MPVGERPWLPGQVNVLAPAARATTDRVASPGVVGGFVGRVAELATLHELAAKVRSGSPQLVWVLGEAGIGKTTMVRRFLAAAGDFTVLSATADRAEADHDYGVVGQLTARVRGPGRPPAGASPSAVGAQLLELLSALQARSPVALVLDDLQWMDSPSALALSFVLRRMWADQVLTIMVARPGEYRPTSLPDQPGDGNVTVLELTGLTVGEVTDLSAATLGTDVTVRAAQRLLEHTGGHPLYLRTLLSELSPEALDHLPLPVPRSLVDAVRGTVTQLPADTRSLLDALAVLDNHQPLATVGALADVSVPDAALVPALRAGLAVRVPNGTVGIVHGLQREAIYGALSPVRRSELHRRAADLVAEPWAHRVASVTTTDADLADQLEEAALAQAAAGQHGTAARYLDWAADLSPDGPNGERRRQLSCVHTLLSQGHTRALELRETITRCADSPLRSLALGLTALLAAGDRATADRWLSAAVRSSDPWTRSTAAAGLAGVRTWQGQADEAIAVARLALTGGGLPPRLADYTRVLLAVAGARRDGMHRGLDELAHLPRDPMLVGPADLDALSCRGALRTMIGAFAEAKRDLRTVIARQRAGNFTMSGTNPLSYLTAIHYVEGAWDDATITIGQALSMMDTEEQPQNQALRRMCAALVPAGRGQWAVAMRHARRASRVADQLGGPQDVRYAAIAAATVSQAQADPTSMLAALSPLAEAEPAGTHSWWALWWRPLLVEALMGVGDQARAAEQLRILSGLSEGVTYLTSTLVRLETALSPPARATAVVEEYLDDRTTVYPLADGLLEHDHGRRLLAAGRRDAAVRWLTSAKTRFTHLAATPFTARVDTDLGRCGVRTGPRPRAPLPGLTEREAQVAHLVSRRLTNRQIAGQLYVTTKTVEYHLGNIYAKLGITSRTQLRDLLGLDPPNGR